MKLLNGSELVGYIKERQAKAVRRLKQALNVNPKLVIVQTNDNPAINTYVRLKKLYGEEIGIEVDSFKGSEEEASEYIKKSNDDNSVHGIIVQLPLKNELKTDELINLVNKVKDVDGLARKTNFDPATPTAILWLLAGYNVELARRSIAVVGQGRLVGRPLSQMLEKMGHNVHKYDHSTVNLGEKVKLADIVITATGEPGLIKPSMLKQGAVVVDAGTAGEGGKIVGDLSPTVFERQDLTLTPQKGGVGPLTVCALFENVIQSANQRAKNM